MEFHASDVDTVQRRLAIATEAAHIGLWDWNLLTGEMLYSRLAKTICGFPEDGAVTLDMVRAVTHPEDLPRTWAMSQRAMDPEICAYEPYRYRIIRADTGEVRWVLAFGRATFGQVGGQTRCVAYTGTIQDITDQKRAEDFLVENEARLKLALEASDMAVWEVDVSTGIVTHSPRLNALCGFPTEAEPTLAEFQAHYAPGELERITTLAAEIQARGEDRMETDLQIVWPDGTPKWVRLRAVQAPGGEGNRVIGVLYDITDRKNAEERTELIARELRHRLKNTLAVLQSIASQSIRGHADREDGLAALNGRLAALAQAAASVNEGDWQNASLSDIIERVLSPYWDTPGDKRVVCYGQDVRIAAGFASALALALHELATNSAKYGALSVPGGQVRLDWTIRAGDRFELIWQEDGGPEVVRPTRAGFGTKMIERALFVPFEGHATIDYHPSGVRCRVVATLPGGRH